MSRNLAMSLTSRAAVACTVAVMASTAFLLGCGGGAAEPTSTKEPKPVEKRPSAEKSPAVAKAPKTTSPRKPPVDNPPADEPRILGDLLAGAEGDKPFEVERMAIDEPRLTSQGIRKLTGKHLTLYTDLPAAPDVDELPEVFDQAVPQWCEYFGVASAKVEDWRMTAFVMSEKERFVAAGALPDDLPEFEFGYQQGHEFWVYEQPSVYYRRHLLLHEGTHAFMNWQLGGAGPPWYMEGMAELMGTHRWQDGVLTLRYTIRDRSEAEYWGRVKIIQDAYAANRGKMLLEIMKYDDRAHRETVAYAWCWAACAFFDAHPKFRDRFQALVKRVADRSPKFSADFYEALQADWGEISEQWQLLVIEMDYGYDVARAAVQYKLGQPLPAGGATVEVAVDRGWQSTGIRVEQGTAYTISASGRYQVGDRPKIWWCEPGGVTIHYHRGFPLGMLVAAVRDDDNPFVDNASPLVTPQPIGLGGQFTFPRSGTLYLKINEAASGLSDNAGTLNVRIAK